MDVTGVRSEQWSRGVALGRGGGRGSEEAEGIARDRDEDEGGGRRKDSPGRKKHHSCWGVRCPAAGTAVKQRQAKRG